MPDPALFAASRIKVVRARTFIGELDRALAAYVHSNPMSVRQELAGPEPGFEVSWRDIGLEPGAIVGDCIHNLRSALDLMASELARINGRSDKKVYFPFAYTETDLPAQIAGKHFDYCGEDAVDLLRTMSPYTGGNIRLRAIHDLDLQDKHRALIPHMASAGVKVAVIASGVSFQEVGHHFMFPPDGPLARQPLVTTLQELAHLVEDVLDAFARMVAARAS